MLQSLFLSIGQDCENAFSGNIGDDQYELFMTLFEGDLINPQHPCGTCNGRLSFQGCPTVEDLFSGRVAQSLADGNGLACTGYA